MNPIIFNLFKLFGKSRVCPNCGHKQTETGQRPDLPLECDSCGKKIPPTTTSDRKHNNKPR